jgi:hypothetical protein
METKSIQELEAELEAELKCCDNTKIVELYFELKRRKNEHLSQRNRILVVGHGFDKTLPLLQNAFPKDEVVLIDDARDFSKIVQPQPFLITRNELTPMPDETFLVKKDKYADRKKRSDLFKKSRNKFL